MNLEDAAQVDSVYAALRSFADLRLQGPPKDLKSGTSFDERGGLIFP